MGLGEAIGAAVCSGFRAHLLFFIDDFIPVVNCVDEVSDRSKTYQG